MIMVHSIISTTTTSPTTKQQQKEEENHQQQQPRRSKEYKSAGVMHIGKNLAIQASSRLCRREIMANPLIHLNKAWIAFYLARLAEN